MPYPCCCGPTGTPLTICSGMTTFLQTNGYTISPQAPSTITLTIAGTSCAAWNGTWTLTKTGIFANSAIWRRTGFASNSCTSDPDLLVQIVCSNDIGGTYVQVTFLAGLNLTAGFINYYAPVYPSTIFGATHTVNFLGGTWSVTFP